MITVRSLGLNFGARTLFSGVDFVINDGEKIGLIGRNGSGKSTFLKLILGEMKPSEGKITVDDGCKIGYLDQHLKFHTETVLDEACYLLPLERSHESWKADKMLRGLGFSDDQILSNPNDLSGGYQIKVKLAQLLMQEPDILFLDEPTNYLDIYATRWLGDFLRKQKNTLILITHDREFMDKIITHTLMIHRGNFRKMAGKTDKLTQKIETEEEMYEKRRIGIAKEREKKQEWVDRFRSKASKASQVQSVIKGLEKQETMEALEDEDELSFRFASIPFGSKDNMAEVKNLSFGYDPNHLLFRNLSFNVRQGEKICIIGKNGNGKTTLLRALFGQITPLSGGISFHNKVDMGYFGQTNVSTLDPKKNIYQELESVNYMLPQGKIRQVASSMMFSGSDAFREISVLSGGEKSRVLLGKVILRPVNLLLLDEPTNHFDFQSAQGLMDAILAFDGAVVMISHDEYFLKKVATKLIVFDGGKVFVFDGGYEDFLDKIGWSESY